MKTYLTIIMIALLAVISHSLTTVQITPSEPPSLEETVQDHSETKTQQKETDSTNTHQSSQDNKEQPKQKDTQTKVVQQSTPKKKEVTQQKKSQSQSSSKKTETQKKSEISQSEKQETSLLTSQQQSLICSAFIERINQLRTEPVVLDASLYQSATLRAKEASQKWSHTRPNGSRWNTTLTSVINIKKTAHGENLAQTQIKYKTEYSDDEIIQIINMLHQQLTNSSTHCQVMTNSHYKKVNIGIHTLQQDNLMIITIAQHFTA